MLVLSRKVGDWIAVDHRGERLWIGVVQNTGDKCRLGLDGPPTFSIMRSELLGRPPVGDPPPDVVGGPGGGARDEDDGYTD